MSRSLWKNSYSELFFLNLKRKNSININYRNLNILKRHVGVCLFIHNGRYYIFKRIYENNIGHKLGEFSFTTSMGSGIHIKNKNKKKNL